MRTATTNFQNHLLQQCTTLAACWLFVRKDGVKIRHTNHDRAIPIADGQFYDGSYITGCSEHANAIQVKVDMSVNNVELHGFYIANDITELHLLAQLYDNAPVYIFATNWKTPSDGIVKLLRGNMGQIVRQGEGFSIEFRSIAQQLQFNMCSLISSTCRSNFASTGTGSADGCRYPQDPLPWNPTSDYFQDFLLGGALTDVKPTTENGFQYRCISSGTSSGSEPAWNTTVGGTTNDGTVVWETRPAAKRTGVVTVGTDLYTLEVGSILGPLDGGTGGSATGGYFAPGQVIFTSGQNDTLTRRILSFEQSGSNWLVKLKDPFPYVPGVGDTLFLQVDCDKAWETCQRFGNYKNFRGENKTPGNDALYKVHPAIGGKK